MPAAGFLPPRTERAAARAIPAAAALAPSARRRGFAFATLAFVLDFAAGFATGVFALRAVFFAFDAIAAAPLWFETGTLDRPENAARLKQTACRGATQKAAGTAAFRSDERQVGKECVRTGRSRCSP